MLRSMQIAVRYVLVLTTMVSASACVPADEKERRRVAIMVEQAKADAVAESVFVQDSLALLSSITVDTVASVTLVQPGASDEEGNSWIDTIYQAIARRGTVCAIDSSRFATLTGGDTLSCQWEKVP